MCKLLIMTGITEGLVAEEFMKRMATPMSRTNNHGIGYTAVSPSGELFSERWLLNNQFMSTKNVMTPEIAEALQPYADRLPEGSLDMNYSRMGNVDFSDVRTITMHTRFATCGRDFANTHPFIYEDTSLIHNGTINNAFSSHYRTGLDVNKISTCDSEAALQTYLSQGVNLDTTKAKQWLDLLTGSWAFGILTRNQQGNRVLDVIRGISRLYYMEIDGVGKVFTTDNDDAKEVVRAMNLTFTKEPIFLASDEMYRYDAVTGEFLESVDIKPVYKQSGGYQGKTIGRTTTQGTGASTSQATNSSKRKAGESLIALIDGIKDDPEAMSLLPDIFTDTSNIKNLRIDHRKVKKFGNDLTIPLLERLDVFDMVFNTDFVTKFASLPPQLRDYIRGTDGDAEGLKSVRGLINQLYEKKEDSVG